MQMSLPPRSMHCSTRFQVVGGSCHNKDQGSRVNDTPFTATLDKRQKVIALYSLLRSSATANGRRRVCVRAWELHEAASARWLCQQINLLPLGAQQPAVCSGDIAIGTLIRTDSAVMVAKRSRRYEHEWLGRGRGRCSDGWCGVRSPYKVVRSFGTSALSNGFGLRQHRRPDRVRLLVVARLSVVTS